MREIDTASNESLIDCLEDNEAGHAAGWNPPGNEQQFYTIHSTGKIVLEMEVYYWWQNCRAELYRYGKCV